jgi:poly(A) polymerase
LTGDEIMAALDIPPGPAVGRAYRFLLEQRIEDGPLGRERALEVLAAWWAEQG